MHEFSGIAGEHRADVYAKDNAGRTPLHVAVELKDGTLVRHLLTSSPYLYEKDHQGITPMQIAEKSEDTEIYSLLSDYLREQEENKGSSFPTEKKVLFTEDGMIIRTTEYKGGMIGYTEDSYGKTPLYESPSRP